MTGWENETIISIFCCRIFFPRNYVSEMWWTGPRRLNLSLFEVVCGWQEKMWKGFLDRSPPILQANGICWNKTTSCFAYNSLQYISIHSFPSIRCQLCSSLKMGLIQCYRYKHPFYHNSTQNWRLHFSIWKVWWLKPFKSLISTFWVCAMRSLLESCDLGSWKINCEFPVENRQDKKDIW